MNPGIFVLSSLLVSTLLAAAPGLAQTQPPAESVTPDSIKGVELKGKAPVNLQMLRVVLPKPQEAALPNGLRICLLEDHKLPTFSMQLIIGGGGLADPADKHGLAMVTASLLREGTALRTSRDIAEQLATLGATLSAGASPSSGDSSVTLTGLSENVDAILALAADVVRNPSFPQAEVDKFKSRYLSRVEYQRSLPNFVAQEQFFRAVYGEHPGSYVVPTEAMLKALTRADIAGYHDAWYRPNNITLIVYGDLTLKDAIAKLDRAFGNWSKGADRKVKLPPLTPPGKGRVLLVDRPGSVQTSLWLGGLGIERNSPDYFAVLVMNHILGGSPASRLFVNLREDKGYTYGVSSTFTGSMFPGVLVATTDVRTEVTEGAMKELVAEIGRISSEPVSDTELRDAKRALVGRFALSLDAPQTLVANLATQKIYGLPADYWDTYPARVEAVTATDIQRVARKYYDAGRLQIVAVGDGAQVRGTLEKYGTVETPAAAL
jgi:zinc protease